MSLRGLKASDLPRSLRIRESMSRGAGILADAERTKNERRFLKHWTDAGGPEIVPQHRGIEGRKWAFDFAHLPSRTAYECHGSTWVAGTGHSSGVGIKRDREKALAAYLAGWQVIELVPEQITANVVQKLIKRIESSSPVSRLVAGLSLPSSRARSMAQMMGSELGLTATPDALAALAELKGGGE